MGASLTANRTSRGRTSDTENDRDGILLQVPEGADVWFDGHKMQQAGSVASFEAGYELLAPRSSAVHAGDRLHVNLIAMARQNARPAEKKYSRRLAGYFSPLSE